MTGPLLILSSFGLLLIKLNLRTRYCHVVHKLIDAVDHDFAFSTAERFKSWCCVIRSSFVNIYDESPGQLYIYCLVIMFLAERKLD